MCDEGKEKNLECDLNFGGIGGRNEDLASQLRILLYCSSALPFSICPGLPSSIVERVVALSEIRICDRIETTWRHRVK